MIFVLIRCHADNGLGEGDKAVSQVTLLCKLHTFHKSGPWSSPSGGLYFDFYLHFRFASSTIVFHFSYVSDHPSLDPPSVAVVERWLPQGRQMEVNLT